MFRNVVAVCLALLTSAAAGRLAAQEPAGIPEAWHIHSPFMTVAKTRQMLDAIGFQVLTSYAAPLDVPHRPGALADRPGTLLARTFTRLMPDGATRYVDVAIAANPAGGYELYVTGEQVHNGQSEPNPDMQAIEAGIEKLVPALAPPPGQAETGPIDRRRLAVETYQLSYIEGDRAMAALKALDYSTIEFNDTPGETLYDKIFAPSLDKDRLRLPVIIKMIPASKTSLQENTVEPPSYSYRGSDLLPDLGGIFLHRTPAAEPQNRLMIAYDTEDPASLERVVNLLHDKIDVAARQLTLEALVIEINGDVTHDLGISWEFSGTSTGGNDFGGSINKGQLLNNAPLTFVFSRATDMFSFKATLAALLSENKAKILSNPSVLVLDGRQAKIQIGQRIPVVETTVTQSATTESILYFPVGIVLNLRPRLSADGNEVSMLVETIVSSVRTQTLGGSLASQAPEVDSRQVQTIVRVHNDTPFIIGGLTSNEDTTTRTGVPLLSEIPWFGALFRRDIKERTKREIIIVVTPHLVPDETKEFSYVIPQASPVFDMFGRELLYNAYRIRQEDVFNLGFLRQSDAYRSLQSCARRYIENRIAPGHSEPTLAPLLQGVVPGEEILVRRMLWEIIRRTGYGRYVNLDNAVMFEKVPERPGEPGFKVAFLGPKLAALNSKQNALVLSYDAGTAGTPEHPFTQPTADLSYEHMQPEDFFPQLVAGNRRTATGVPERWTMILTEAYSGTVDPFDVLRGVIVLRRLIALNPSLGLSLDAFRAGRQIIFPSESELREGHPLIDTDTARLFYEITDYYPAFESEFKLRGRKLADYMGGCEWWDASRPVTGAAH